MSKPKVTQREPRPVLGVLEGKSRDDAVDLEVALSQAWAARILLAANSDKGILEMPRSLPAGETEDNIRGWIEGFAFDKLDDALKGIEAARKKLCGPRLFGKDPKRKAAA